MSAEQERRSGRPWAVALTVVVLAAIVCAAALARTSTGARVTRSLGIRSDRQTYTALSFVNPSQVSSQGFTYRAGVVRDHVAFRIANDTRSAITYRWRISFSPARPVISGETRVEAGGSAAVGRDVVTPCGLATPGRTAAVFRRLARSRPARAQIRVQLAPSGDHIAFWERCG